jgi:prolyl-tRNA synthetase
MKDMYSFARTQTEHDELYEKAAVAYTKVYDRLGIGAETYRTAADGGYFTEKFSDEYQTLSDIGEDTIYVDEAKKLAINKEIYTDENLSKLGLVKQDLVEKKSVEVGNIFPLESKYSDALNLYYADESGERQSIIMGCYGIGVSRLMGAIAEKFADDKGLIWPAEIAPFQVYLISISLDEEVLSMADKLYKDLQAAGIKVLWDDRDARPGEKFADADLIGIPHRVVISPKTVAETAVEYKARTSDEVMILTADKILEKIACI